MGGFLSCGASFPCHCASERVTRRRLGLLILILWGICLSFLGWKTSFLYRSLKTNRFVFSFSRATPCTVFTQTTIIPRLLSILPTPPAIFDVFRSLFGALLFCGYILYDTSNIINRMGAAASCPSCAVVLSLTAPPQVQTTMCPLPSNCKPLTPDPPLLSSPSLLEMTPELQLPRCH